MNKSLQLYKTAVNTESLMLDYKCTFKIRKTDKKSIPFFVRIPRCMQNEVMGMNYSEKGHKSCMGDLTDVINVKTPLAGHLPAAMLANGR